MCSSDLDLHNHVNGDPSRKVAALEEEQLHGSFNGGGEAGHKEICQEVRTHGKLLIGGPLQQHGHLTVSSSQLASKRESSLRGTSVVFSQNAICAGVGANMSVMRSICAA